MDDLGRWTGRNHNWGRWDNDLGAVNLITPEAVMRGLRTVTQGEVIPLARPVSPVEPLEPTVLYEQDLYQDAIVPSVAPIPTHSVKDTLTFRVHSMVNTHIDAFAHIGFNGVHFNGRKHSDVVERSKGIKALDISNVLGIATRGVIMDIARLRGVRQLDPFDRVGPEDIRTFLNDVAPGDAVFVRTGATPASGQLNPDPDNPAASRGVWTGLHPDCIDLISERGASLFGGDCVEALPSVVADECALPVHVACLVVHGLPIVHSMNLEELSARCAALGRRHFFFVVGALNAPGASGTPVAPIAIV